MVGYIHRPNTGVSYVREESSGDLRLQQRWCATHAHGGQGQGGQWCDGTDWLP